MGFTVRQMDTQRKFSSVLTVDALAQVIPQSAVTDVIAQEGVGHKRERRLTAELTLYHERWEAELTPPPAVGPLPEAAAPAGNSRPHPTLV